MTANRRDLIKASAAIGLLGVSEASAAPTKVLLVSSIPVTSDMIQNFNNGFSTAGGGVFVAKGDDLKYSNGDTAPIEKFIKDNHGPNSLIVTVGGSITHTAAKKSSSVHQKNWIALLGVPDPSDPPPDKFLGGVVLGTATSNYDSR
jgi:hypothetical protein